MEKRIACAYVLFCCAACAGPKPAVEEPATPEVESPPAAEPSSEEPAAEPDESTPAPESAPEPTETKKKCEELDKSTCKVTVGCGWNDLKKCVSTNVSE